MFKRELTLVVALFGVLSLALFSGCQGACDPGSTGGKVSLFGIGSAGGKGSADSSCGHMISYTDHPGAWLMLPDANNDMNFFIIDYYSHVSSSSFQADSVSYNEPTSNTFKLTITAGISTEIINGAFISNTTGTYEAFPSGDTGTIKMIEDRSACLNMHEQWYLWLGEDGGAGSILASSLGGFSGELAQVRENYFWVDDAGYMLDTPFSLTLEVTNGVMLCNGTMLGDPIVGYFETTEPGVYNSVKFVAIINDVSGPITAGGLYDNASGSAWPAGTVKLIANSY